MDFLTVHKNKEAWLPLLLLADEQESLIAAYLSRGVLHLLRDEGGVLAAAVVTDEGDGVLELQNLAVVPQARRRGLGRAMIEWLCGRYRGRFRVLRAGTGDSPLTLPFYAACGFRQTGRERNYFPSHYDHPIFEAGRPLVDRVLLERTL